MEYHITHYDLEQGALEIQYIEEFFGEFPRKKTAAEIVRRLRAARTSSCWRMRRCPTIPARSCRCRSRWRTRSRWPETEPKLVDLVDAAARATCSSMAGACSTPGSAARAATGAARDIFRALTEQQELWAIEQGFDEIVVKTKNKFYEMRGTLDHLRFEVVKYERNAARQRRIEGLSEQEAAA